MSKLENVTILGFNAKGFNLHLYTGDNLEFKNVLKSIYLTLHTDTIPTEYDD